MTQVYRVALSQSDYTPPALHYTHVCRAHVNGVAVETRHYSAEDARREAEWRSRCGEVAEVVTWQK